MAEARLEFLRLSSARAFHRRWFEPNRANLLLGISRRELQPILLKFVRKRGLAFRRLILLGALLGGSNDALSR
jgi:hypothetical protein